MKRLPKTLCQIVCVVGIAACAASNDDRSGVTSMQPSSGQPACLRANDWCRWDNQCCSGRCYADTGCNGPDQDAIEGKKP
jgi:hypothetical protein